MVTSLSRRFRGVLPLLPVAPVIVVIVGLTLAVVIALLGIRELEAANDDAAHLRADALSTTLAARLAAYSGEDRAEVPHRASQRTAAEMLLVDPDGQVMINESFERWSRDEILKILQAREGETRTALGRAWFVARPVGKGKGSLAVVTFVAAPRPPPGSIALVNGVIALTILLLGIAVAVALAYTKSARDDVDYVRRRIVDMARADEGPAGEPVPIRSLDQVGVLTAAFNLLVLRFSAAERSYRADLRQAAEGARERSAFLAGLSHELRTPLNAILGFTHVLESEVDGPLSDDAKESLLVIKTSGEHLKHLIDDVLDLSALETGQLKLAKRRVDVRELAEEVVREARATVRDKPVGLTVTGQAGLFANGDPRRVRQVLTNLITNAIKATTEGWVEVKIDGRLGYVGLVVSDTGAGISPEDTKAIFQAYRQAGTLRSRRGGTGLGLSIAQRLVEMHGGTIEVESQLGVGSTFTVWLPRLDSAEAQETSKPDYTVPRGSWFPKDGK